MIENLSEIKIDFRDVHFCVRDDCYRTSGNESGFCTPCLEWISGQTDIDPLKVKP